MVNKALNDRIISLYIKRAIKSIIPTETASREHSHCHILSNYLPRLEPINNDHNEQKYRFYAFELASGYYLAKMVLSCYHLSVDANEVWDDRVAEGQEAKVHRSSINVIMIGNLKLI